MSDSFEFEELEFLTVGTLGPKGERVFYLQCRASGELVTLKLEKQQVAALAEYLDRILEELPVAEVSDPPSDLDLREPVVEAWTIGALGVAYTQDDDRLVVIAEELVDDEEDPASARLGVSREQVTGLIRRAREVVTAGRPPCPYCSRPLEPRNGDWCPCQN